MTRLYLPTSAAPTNWFSSYTPGTTLQGTTGNDQLAANAPEITLIGDGGDDTFIVYDPSDIVIEVPNSGVSTVLTWGAGYSLPANVQNLTLEGSADAYAVGNSLDNILTANSGNDRLIAGSGNDILVGGSGDDTFVISAGGGLDEIQNFRPGANSGDVVQLAGFSFSSFADIQAAMTQVGTDTVLNLGDGQSINFDNTTVGSFAASDFNAPFSPTGLTMSFDDEFNSLSLNIGGNTGTWNTTFSDGARTLASNNELEEYMDSAYAGTASAPLGVNPFSDNNGVLAISAEPTSASVAPYIDNMPYTSGLLTTQGTFAQTYGYWEIRAELPQGDGLWPAFWLLPEDGSWPPEVDIMEVLGNDPSTIYNSFHGTGGTGFSQATHVSNLSSGFHTFGFDWTPTTMTWYVDGLQTAQIATPSYMDKPMYMLIDLAVGGNWPGAPDATTQFPANMDIDYVHVYSLAQVNGAQASAPPAAPSGLALDPSTDSGIKGDGITNVAQPKIDGQGIAGDTVTLYDGTTLVGSSTVASNGAWTVTTSTLANGAHSLTATETDAAGNTSASSSPLVVTIDTIPPSAPSALALDPSTDSGIKGDGVTNVAQPKIDGQGVAGDTVALYDGTTLVGGTTVGGNGAWSITPSTLASGAHSLTATETGAAGNVSASSATLPLDILKPVVPNDLYGNGYSDLVFQNTGNGQIAVWEMNGFTSVAGGPIGPAPGTQWNLAGIGDINGDGNNDLIFQNVSDGQVSAWEVNGTSIIGSGLIGPAPGADWRLGGVADVNGDGRDDLIFQNENSGQISTWELNGTSIIGGGIIGTLSTDWRLAGTGDLNGDGHTDLLFQNDNTGQILDWEVDGASIIRSATIGTGLSGWTLAGVGDLNGDGCSDLVFENNSNGEVQTWEMNGTSVVGGATFAMPAGAGWQLTGVEDLNGAGPAELVFQNAASGQVWGYETNGASILASANIGMPTSIWHLAG